MPQPLWLRIEGARQNNLKNVSLDIPHDRVTILEIPALAISSSECRERRAKGEPVWYLVPDGVVQYIVKHDLYSMKV